MGRLLDIGREFRGCGTTLVPRSLEIAQSIYPERYLEFRECGTTLVPRSLEIAQSINPE